LDDPCPAFPDQTGMEMFRGCFVQYGDDVAKIEFSIGSYKMEPQSRMADQVLGCFFLSARRSIYQPSWKSDTTRSWSIRRWHSIQGVRNVSSMSCGVFGQRVRERDIVTLNSGPVEIGLILVMTTHLCRNHAYINGGFYEHRRKFTQKNGGRKERALPKATRERDKPGDKRPEGRQTDANAPDWHISGVVKRGTPGGLRAIHLRRAEQWGEFKKTTKEDHIHWWKFLQAVNAIRLSSGPKGITRGLSWGPCCLPHTKKKTGLVYVFCRKQVAY